ncbi:HPr family phosphocarrier protein [Leptospira sp. 2 VSF19]|uniref:HPr family phosphocarrier protein n=1 Tax=Leptospira soteropolitanensis TaxID=2950025 RepID=A0AAW5VN17_9LEPT|nr:HPr family phosphocarrier protein [Leptospira soteropolitanensis]MCW7492230.1 HPr family phosphocarrier protein [Leptospira soteropolitanensis]MCW7499812.1 HPr family phosphocarrier protein [Leptospira soteropolitanensis]MCW7522063.1 HPr family phosphocarrier protein [Leptospira soteropolitanensis]MCW7525917.1 HPr family phosphocarrier protein [Leptospira soteropolitanensis]MCW7529969.1 HPr family phosphocarrier protein [Leptospira soteropolitanensis]
MKQIQLKIREDSSGLHARPASLFVKMAASFPCEIFVVKDDIEVNGKSIMGLMMLALGPGSIFSVKADGKGEEEALLALEALVDRNFDTNAN